LVYPPQKKANSLDIRHVQQKRQFKKLLVQFYRCRLGLVEMEDFLAGPVGDYREAELAFFPLCTVSLGNY